MKLLELLHSNSRNLSQVTSNKIHSRKMTTLERTWCPMDAAGEAGVEFETLLILDIPSPDLKMSPGDDAVV